jgi:hypothetical protein
MKMRMMATRYRIQALLAGTVIGLTGCFGSDTPTTSNAATTVVSGRWIAEGVLGKDVSDYRILLDLTSSDGFVLSQQQLSGGNDVPDTLLAGRIVERSGSRVRLSWTGGSKSSRNLEGWVRLDTSKGRVFLAMISRHASGTGASPFPTGTWTCGSWPGGSGTVSIKADGNWSLSTSRSDSGTWVYGAYPDSAAIVSAGGIDPVFARYLAGRNYLSALSSLHLVEGDATSAWFDQIGDGAMVRFAPAGQE